MGSANAHNILDRTLVKALSVYYCCNKSSHLIMAAALNAIRAALQRMGFSQEASNHITDANGQGLNDLTHFEYLLDTEVENLCRQIRKPGGQIANPAAAPGNNAPARIPNPGIPIAMTAENNLKRMCYYVRHSKRTSRTITAADITTANVRSLIEYRRWEDVKDDPTAPELTFRDWPRTIETIEEYLFNFLGTTKIPLAYIVRENSDVPAADPVGGYETIQAELVARAPHHDGANPPVYTQTFKDDNQKVYELIAALTRDKDCWTYVQSASRTRDGRKAFYGLKNHYLGPNNVDNMATQAEGKLQNTTYSGEQRRWNFEKYVKTHVDQHAIIDGLTVHGYAGIDPRSKVRYLLEGIKTDQFDSVKAAIYASETLRKDFDGCVLLFKDFIKQKGFTRTANISAVQLTRQKNQRNDWDKVDPDMTIEDRYYDRKEYSKLTIAQKKGLSIKRKKRGHKSKKDGKGRPQLSKREVKAVKRLLQKDDDKGDDVDDDASESDGADPPTNRNNKALKRKKV